MTLGSAIKFWLSIGCFTQEYMENITVALRFFEEYTFNSFAHCGYTLKPPRRGGSNRELVPRCIFWGKTGYAFHGHVFMIFEFLLFSFHKHGLFKLISITLLGE